MELNICHLYPDLLNAYGDYGNILILKNRAEQRDIKINIHNISVNDTFDDKLYDIVLFGGGQDFEQSIVSKDIQESKKENIENYIENNKVFLAVCGGYQLLGEYYNTPEGEKLPGLSILPIRTEAGDTRFVGNTIIYNETLNESYVGFENHSGRTYINNLEPLGIVRAGYGNNGEDNTEGCIYKNTYGTYFHGCLLSKNPELADRLLKAALENKYEIVEPLKELDDTLELEGKAFIINAYGNNNSKSIKTK